MSGNAVSVLEYVSVFGGDFFHHVYICDQCPLIVNSLSPIVEL